MDQQLDWTGERLVTSIKTEDTIYHLHRYAVALQYVKNKVVLDIASGEGYGTNLIAKNSKYTYGVDISDKAVKFAQQKYRGTKNLEFITGSVEAIPLDNQSVDVVVSFETLEHTDKHEEMMKEIRRVLKTDGMLIISSPDKANYSDRFNRINEFHVKELYFTEFKSIISNYFKHSIFFYQAFLTGSIMLPENISCQEINEFSGSFETIENQKTLSNLMFNISIASDNQFTGPSASYFEGTEVMRDFYYSQVMKFTPYRLGNLLLKPFRYIFKR